MEEMGMNQADARGTVLGRKAISAEKEWSEHTRAIPPLMVGDTVMVQNQSGNHPLRWDKRGTIVKSEGFDQYQVMIDGSRRLTIRNRSYLRLFTPFGPNMTLTSRPAEAIKTTATVPANRKTLRQEGPVEVQRQHDKQCDEPVEVRGHQDQ
jgi:hypothetical protein